MAKNQNSQYQNKLISNYYENIDSIMLQKLSELVTELYLAETDKKRARLWDRAQKAMINLKIPLAIIEHIMNKKSIEILAKNLQEWLAKKKK